MSAMDPRLISIVDIATAPTHWFRLDALRHNPNEVLRCVGQLAVQSIGAKLGRAPAPAGTLTCTDTWSSVGSLSGLARTADTVSVRLNAVCRGATGRFTSSCWKAVESVR